jgi:acetolactate synthase-1/2/3 large subunit
MATMKGAKILIESLLKEDVEVVFGYPGGQVLDIYDALYAEKRLKHILVRHEQGAAHAADGYARTTGKVGVCLATSGPGATNLVTGIATAYMDSIPMVAISGQVPTTAIGTDAFQEADMTGITLPITKHNYLVRDVKDLTRIVKEAFHLARTGRPGPVLIDIPSDIAKAVCEFEYPTEPLVLDNYRPTIKGNPRQIKQAIELILSSQRPLFLAGGGLLSAGACAEFTELVDTLQIPVSPTLMGLGCIPTEHPLNLGMPGMHGTATANYAICESDLLIAIGMRFDNRITGKLAEFAPKAKVIHIDIDPAEINKCIPVHLPIIGDAKEIVKEFLQELKAQKKPKYTEWLKQLKTWQKTHPLAYDTDSKFVKPQYLLEVLNKLTKGESVYTTDVGTHQMFACQYLKLTRPRQWASSGGLGTMGYGVPAAMGAAFGNKGKDIYCISGDGSFQMNIQELGTIATNKLPVKIIIFNNHWLGMVRQWQEIFYQGHYSHTDLTECQPDFMKIAEAYGIKGIRITKPSEVEPAFKEMIKHKGPVILDAHIERAENVFPMVPPGGILNKMLFSHNYREGK